MGLLDVHCFADTSVHVLTKGSKWTAMTRLSYDSRVLSSRCRCEVGLLRGVDRQGVGWPDGGEADEGREGWAKARCSPAAVRRPLSRRSVGVRYYTGLPSLSHPSPGVSGLVRGCAKNPQGQGIVAPPTKASSPSRRPCSFFLHLTHFFSIVPSSAFFCFLRLLFLIS